MCKLSQTQCEIVRDEVEDFMRNGVLFTSVDIANDIKSHQKHWMRNRDVADFLRNNVEVLSLDLVSCGDIEEPWIATYSRMDNGKFANVYHPLSVSADDYITRDLEAISPDRGVDQNNDDWPLNDQNDNVPKVPFDFNGVEFQIGDTVYYPTRKESSMWMNKGVVEDTFSSSPLGMPPCIKVRKNTGRLVTIKAVENVVIMR